MKVHLRERKKQIRENVQKIGTRIFRRGEMRVGFKKFAKTRGDRGQKFTTRTGHYRDDHRFYSAETRIRHDDGYLL